MTRAALVISLVAALGCRSTPTREDRAPRSAAPATSGDASVWETPPRLTGTPLPEREARFEPLRLPLGDDLLDAALVGGVWVGVEHRHREPSRLLRQSKDGGAPTALLSTDKGYLRLRRSPAGLFVHFEPDRDADEGWLGKVEAGGVRRIVGARDVQWFAQTTAGLRAAFWDLRDRVYAWKLFAVAETYLEQLGPEHTDEMIFGLVPIKGQLVVAAGKPQQMKNRPMEEQVQAATSLVQGDGRLAASLVPASSARGYLIHMTPDGGVAERETFPEQRTEGGVTVTDDGWVVAISSGTLEKGLTDGIVATRKDSAKDDELWQLLARGIPLAQEGLQRGTWVCFVSMVGDDRVVHCVDPGRGIHVRSPSTDGNVTLMEIDGRSAPKRLVLRHHRYGQGMTDETLLLPLP